MTPPTRAEGTPALQAAPHPEGRDPGSYRDPAGFVFHHDGRVLRHIDPPFREDWDALADSGLYDALTAAGLLIPHVDADIALSPEPPA